MEFFGMGSGEILLILIIALIIFGPGKIPEMARQAGKMMRVLKQTTSQVTTQIQKELEEEEKALKASINAPVSTPPAVPPPAPPVTPAPAPSVTIASKLIEPAPLEPQKTSTDKPESPAGNETQTTK
jgi:Tat protein translocase TatB subunit